MELPKEFDIRPIDAKSGWKNNAKILAEIVTTINNEIYVEDESAEMEKIDIVLEWFRKHKGNGVLADIKQRKQLVKNMAIEFIDEKFLRGTNEKNIHNSNDIGDTRENPISKFGEDVCLEWLIEFGNRVASFA